MAKYKLEYIWLDGYQPVPNLRGKTQVKEFDSFPKLEQLPILLVEAAFRFDDALESIRLKQMRERFL